MTDFWLRAMFALVDRVPWLVAALRPPATRLAPVFAPAMRRAVMNNGRRIFGHTPPRDFVRQVVGQFYDFVRDVAAARREPADALRRRAVAIEGEPAYLALRARGGGCVLLTAHMGSFEVGLAALAGVEPCVHVVFKRDAYGDFEAMRTAVRRTLGVHEAAIDDGLPALLKLREALLADAVVVMQGDRAMPGQRAEAVPFLHGTLRLPVGPIKLAQSAGCAVVPVFTVREGPGRFRVFIEPAIDPASPDALSRVARSLETFVRKHPTQWLVLHEAFVEDEPRA